MKIPLEIQNQTKTEVNCIALNVASALASISAKFKGVKYCINYCINFRQISWGQINLTLHHFSAKLNRVKKENYLSSFVHALRVGRVHDEDEAVHLMVILWPNAAEAFAAAEVVNGDVEALVLGLHLREADGGRDVVERLAHEHLGRARLARVVEAEHQEVNVPLEGAHPVAAQHEPAASG